MALCCFTPGHWRLKCMIGVICIAIFGFSACIALSIPFNTTVYYSYAAEIQFNEGMFTGSVNDFSVHNLLTLRLGNWAASYTDSQDPDFKMPGAFAYTVDITSHKSTRTIVTKLNTSLLIIHIAFFISTLSTCFHIHLPKRWTKLYIFEIAIMATSLASILADLWLLSNVSAEMQKLGESIVTREGPVFYLIGIVDFFVLVGAFLNRKLANEIANPAPKTADGKGPAKYQLTVNPASVQPAAPPSAVPLTPYQRVQALMPPRFSPAAQQQSQGVAAPPGPVGNVPPYHGQLRPRRPLRPPPSRNRPTNERRVPSRNPTTTPSQLIVQQYRSRKELNPSLRAVTNPSPTQIEYIKQPGTISLATLAGAAPSNKPPSPPSQLTRKIEETKQVTPGRPSPVGPSSKPKPPASRSIIQPTSHLPSKSQSTSKSQPPTSQPASQPTYQSPLSMDPTEISQPPDIKTIPIIQANLKLRDHVGAFKKMYGKISHLYDFNDFCDRRDEWLKDMTAESFEEFYHKSIQEKPIKISIS